MTLEPELIVAFFTHNALAEAVNELYKTELNRQRGPWRTVEQVELATLGWCGGGTTKAYTGNSI